ncbi:MAG: septum formation initiator family protein [Patescibacteria group bacterium]
MKKIAFIVAIVIGLVIINNLARSTYDLWSKKDVIVSAQNELEAEKKENQRLKNQLERAQDGQFIEQEARNKLLLVKPGEQNVFIPKDLVASESSQTKVDKRPNWQKWWELFF